MNILKKVLGRDRVTDYFSSVGRLVGIGDSFMAFVVMYNVLFLITQQLCIYS